MAVMRFKDTSETMPGYSVYEADDTDTGYHYVIQRKDSADAGMWRVAVRESSDEPLRIIYATTSISDAKSYVKTYRART